MSNVSMGHEYFQNLLPDLLNGKLDVGAEQPLRAHLSECATCRLDAEEIEAGLAAVRRQLPPQIPAHYFGTVLPRIRERLERRAAPSWLQSILAARFAAPLAALALVAILIGRISLNPSSQESSLRSVMGSMSSEELADALTGQSETQWGPSTEIISFLISENAVAKELATNILESDEVNSYQNVSDLSDTEVDLLLQRLGERSIL